MQILPASKSLRLQIPPKDDTEYGKLPVTRFDNHAVFTV